MRRQSVLNKFAEGTMTRRDFSAALASLGLAIVTVPAYSRRAEAGGGKLFVATWPGFETGDLHRKYSRNYGGSPRFLTTYDDQEALAKIRSGVQVDIAHPCLDQLLSWRESGLLVPIDVGRLSNWPDLFDRIKAINGLLDDGRHWIVPFEWGYEAILYRTDLVDPKDVQGGSWRMLFDEKYKDRIAMRDSMESIMGIVGMVIGARDIWNMSGQELKQAQEWLAKQKELVRFYWMDSSNVEAALAAGEIVASFVWHDSYQRLRRRDVPVAYMIPKEGVLMWICGLVKVKSGFGDEQAAYDFIDAMLEPESGANLIDGFGWGHSNRKAYEVMDKERLTEVGLSDPESLMSQAIFYQGIAPKVRDEYDRIFQEIKRRTLR